MDAALTYLFEKLPLIAVMLVFGAAVTLVVWAFSKLYHRFMYVEKGMETFREEMKSAFAQTDEKMRAEFARTDEKMKAEFARTDEKMSAEFARTYEKMSAEFAQTDEKMRVEFARTDEKITSVKTELKNNDLFHLGKAMLIGFSESLKNNPERFERMKDTILESTPDNKKDEIKSITI
jgi:hypothetical protein